MVKESFNFFLVNHCDEVYICSLRIEDTHNKKALIKGNLIKRDFILEGRKKYIYTYIYIYIYVYIFDERRKNKIELWKWCITQATPRKNTKIFAFFV